MPERLHECVETRHKRGMHINSNTTTESARASMPGIMSSRHDARASSMERCKGRACGMPSYS